MLEYIWGDSVRKYTISDLFNPDEKINIIRATAFAIVEDHTHEFLEMQYIVSGKAVHKIAGHSYEVDKGSLLFVNFGQAHSYVCSEPLTYVNILIQPEFISPELIESDNALDMLAMSLFEDFAGEDIHIKPHIHFDGSEVIDVEKTLDDMLNEYYAKQIGYRTALKGLLQYLLVLVFRKFRASDENLSVINHMQRITPEILRYIEDNCFEKLSVSDLAKRCYYNTSYFSRIFKECYGMTLISYIQKKRIDEAVRLLRETDISVEEICRRVGYSEKKHFYKKFHEITGTTPSAFRKSERVKKDHTLTEQVKKDD